MYTLISLYWSVSIFFFFFFFFVRANKFTPILHKESSSTIKHWFCKESSVAGLDYWPVWPAMKKAMAKVMCLSCTSDVSFFLFQKRERESKLHCVPPETWNNASNLFRMCTKCNTSLASLQNRTSNSVLRGARWTHSNSMRGRSLPDRSDISMDFQRIKRFRRYPRLQLRGRSPQEFPLLPTTHRTSIYLYMLHYLIVYPPIQCYFFAYIIFSIRAPKIATLIRTGHCTRMATPQCSIA